MIPHVWFQGKHSPPPLCGLLDYIGRIENHINGFFINVFLIFTPDTIQGQPRDL